MLRGFAARIGRFSSLQQARLGSLVFAEFKRNLSLDKELALPLLPRTVRLRTPPSQWWALGVDRQPLVVNTSEHATGAILEHRGQIGMADIWRSLRYAYRAVWSHPRLTTGSVITLALGIAANAIAFSTVDALLFRPLPVAHAEQLAAVFTGDSSGVKYGTSSYLDYQEFAKTSVFSTTFAFLSALPMTMRGDASPERRRVSAVTGNYFEALGIRPAAGRLLLPAGRPAGRRAAAGAERHGMATDVCA
jgi:hypothetical protein